MLFYIYKISYLENNSNTFRYPFKSTFTYSFMGIGDWGLGPIPNPQSPIPNPPSPIDIIRYINKYINVSI